VTPNKPLQRSQIAGFTAKYSPDVARQFRAARATLRRLFPRGYELVYDNYNALGCGFSPTPRSSDILVSVVAYPRWVTLFFFDGRRLNDPDGLLRGSGVRIRSLRLQPFALINSVAVGKLLAQAIDESRAELKTAPRLSTVIKSVSARQRPRRPPL
jgi:hypothetical protein